MLQVNQLGGKRISPFKNILPLFVLLALLMCCLLNEIMNYTKEKLKKIFFLLHNGSNTYWLNKCISFPDVEDDRGSLRISTRQFVHMSNKIYLLQCAILRASSSLPMLQNKCLSYMKNSKTEVSIIPIRMLCNDKNV